MSMIGASSIGRAVSRCQECMASVEQDLNAADSQLGDGDTGVMLARVIAAMASIDFQAESDIGSLLALMARKTASATGSSLGTLIATALLTVSRRTKGSIEMKWADLSGHLDAAVDAMMARGGATLGDKTVLDILHAVAASLSDVTEADAAAQAAKRAAETTLEEFRDKPNRVGRARMFTDRSVGLDDPGMLAVFYLLNAVAATERPRNG